MSVINFCEIELGHFAAICVHIELIDLKTACTLAERISVANQKAYSERYNEPYEPISYDSIELVALHALAKPESLTGVHFGPLAYNCDFSLYSDDLAKQIEEHIRALEEKCRSWQEAKQREQRKAEENAEAYDEVGQLPVIPAEQIKQECEAAGCKRVIIAEFMVNESDGYTDYYGGRNVRKVVIGYGKGLRENFKQLRKAAAEFPPTQDISTDDFKVYAAFTETYQAHGSYFRKGEGSPWHDEYNAVFSSQEDAEAYIAEIGKPHSVTSGDVEMNFEFRIHQKSMENRENYSMGGGNYLGLDRYSGWKVSSVRVDWFNSDMESAISEPAEESKPEPEAEPQQAEQEPAEVATLPPEEVSGPKLTPDDAYLSWL